MPDDRPGRAPKGKTPLQAKLADMNWSQAKLARMSGVDRRAINRVCTGRTVAPHLGMVRKLARALGCPIEDIVDLDVAEQAFDAEVEVQSSAKSA